MEEEEGPAVVELGRDDVFEADVCAEVVDASVDVLALGEGEHDVDALLEVVVVVAAVAATRRLEMALAAWEKMESTRVASAARELLRLEMIDAASLKIWSTLDSSAAELVGFAVSETAAIRAGTDCAAIRRALVVAVVLLSRVLRGRVDVVDDSVAVAVAAAAFLASRTATPHLRLTIPGACSPW